MKTDLTPIRPELHLIWKRLPHLNLTRRNWRLIQWSSAKLFRQFLPAGSKRQQVFLPGQVRLLIYRPTESRTQPVPALLWIHGGGYLLGTPEMNDLDAFDWVRELGIVVVSVDYRLAPQHPFPAGLEDCYQALKWMHASAQELGIDPARIAVGGGSAGGGLAASLAQMAHDRGEVKLAFQLLVAPMLDDRTVLRSPMPHAELHTWSAPSNRFAWEAYLHQTPGAERLPPYASAARRQDLSGLAPAWIGVGDLDLFLDEDADYARRLQACGVECELVIVPGAFHGLDSMHDDLPIIHEFHRSQWAALKRAFFTTPQSKNG